MANKLSGTRGVFRPLDASVARELIEFSCSSRNVGKSVDVLGKTYTLEHISRSTSAFWKSRGISLYFRTGRSVVRISDHWSETNGMDRSRKFNCGKIGSSFWKIDNHGDDDIIETYSHSAGRFPHRVLAGVCSMRSLERGA